MTTIESFKATAARRLCSRVSRGVTGVVLVGVLVGVGALASPTAAQEALPSPRLIEPFASPSDLTAPLGLLPDLEEVGVDEQALDGVSGKGATTIAVTDQDLTAISSGNSINAANVSSGPISLSDNALAGFGGVGSMLMNTGHNNSLQSNVSVTIIVTQ